MTRATHQAVILRSRALARRLEGRSQASALLAHPSRLAAKKRRSPQDDAVLFALQSARTPLCSITLAHFAVSASIYARNSSGVLLATAITPALRMRAWIAGSASTLTIAAC